MPRHNTVCTLRHIVLITIAVVSTACATPAAPPAAATTSPKQLRERQILVTLSATHRGQWDAMAESLRQEYGLQKAGAFPLKSLELQCLAFVVPAPADITATIERLRDDRRVEHVQRNSAFDNLAPIYNDRYAPMQHGMHKIRAAQVHALSTGTGVRVAVVDTGMDVTHPDIAARIARTENFVDGGEVSFNADAHGTAVAGVIGAQANNGIGVFGAAPNASLLGYKACWYAREGAAHARCSTWTLARAIDRAILDGAQVINLSLSGPRDVLLERLIRRAVAADIAVVAAADASRADAGFPAGLAEVLAVMSDADGAAARPHPVTHRPVVIAPGIDILTAMPNDRYDFVSGSSLAAAHVSGVIALMRGRNPNLSVADIYRSVASPRTLDACDAFAQMLGRAVCDATPARR